MILVTGGTGLAGSYLLEALARRGEQVRALLRPGKRAFDPVQIFECIAPGNENLSGRVEWAEGDVLDLYSLRDAMQGVDRVYHCAALISFNPRDLRQMLRVNVEGTANVVNACLENNVKKLCHISSIAALGSAEPGQVIDENAQWKTTRTNSGYAISKYGGEREVWRGIEEGLDAVIVNPSIILGAGCHPKATNSLFRSMQNFLPFYSNGVNGYVDVRDVVNAMIMLMESDITAQRFVLNSENLSVREFFNLAADLLGKRHPYIPVNRYFMGTLALIEEFRGMVTGTRPMLTRENTRAALSKSYYSSEKFSTAFGYRFIPVEQSLRDAFEILSRNAGRQS